MWAYLPDGPALTDNPMDFLRWLVNSEVEVDELRLIPESVRGTFTIESPYGRVTLPYDITAREWTDLAFDDSFDDVGPP